MGIRYKNPSFKPFHVNNFKGKYFNTANSIYSIDANGVFHGPHWRCEGLRVKFVAGVPKFGNEKELVPKNVERPTVQEKSKIMKHILQHGEVPKAGHNLMVVFESPQREHILVSSKLAKDPYTPQELTFKKS